MSAAPYDPIPVLNTTSEDVPAYAVLEPIGQIDAKLGALLIRKPTGDGLRHVLVNGATAIPAGQPGQAYLAPRVVVAYDTTAELPMVGDEWGSEAGSWLLGTTPGGFIILGGAGGGAVNAVRYGVGEVVGSSSSSSSSGGNGIEVVTDVICTPDDGLLVTFSNLNGFVMIGGRQYPVTFQLGSSGT